MFQHISTPIPSAPLPVELCSFMRCCVDWFRPASDSSGKQLQLPTNLCRVGQHPFLVPDYKQAHLAHLNIYDLSPKAVLLSYPCTPPEALKPLIAHICRPHCPHRLSSRTPSINTFSHGALSPLPGSVKPHQMCNKLSPTQNLARPRARSSTSYL